MVTVRGLHFVGMTLKLSVLPDLLSLQQACPPAEELVANLLDDDFGDPPADLGQARPPSSSTPIGMEACMHASGYQAGQHHGSCAAQTPSRRSTWYEARDFSRSSMGEALVRPRTASSHADTIQIYGSDEDFAMLADNKHPFFQVGTDAHASLQLWELRMSTIPVYASH